MNSLATNQKPIFYWQNIYNMGDKTTTFNTRGGKFSFKSASLQLPKLITRSWVVRMLGEHPKLTFNNEIIHSDIDYTDMITKLFAYGKIIVVPYINDFNEFKYYCIHNFNNLDVVLLSGAITQLTIPTMSNQYYQYQLDLPSNRMLVREVIEDEEKLMRPISEWEPTVLTPFYLELNINADRYPVPIWGNAVDLIEDANIAHHELMIAMNLQRPIVLIPDTVGGAGLHSDTNTGIEAPYFLSEHMRAISTISGLDQDLQMIKQIGGNFDPKPYVDSLNYMLSQIGVLCGLGKDALNFKEQGGTSNSRVTATEIVYAQNDAYVNSNMVKRIVAKAIAILESAKLSYDKGQEIDYRLIDVFVQDNLADNKQEFNAMLSEDYRLGVISKEFYLSQRYPEFNINDIINKEITNEVSNELVATYSNENEIVEVENNNE